MHALLLAFSLQGRVDDAVAIVMRSQHVAGMSVGIAQNGRIVYARGFGEADALRHEEARPDTVYRVGSLTKMFTARAVLLLAERRKLNLDRPAARYLPEFPWGGNVTVRDLLAQRSGIPSYSDDPSLNPYAWYAPAQLVGAVAAQPLVFAPGTQFAYSNTNYVLLGMIAQRIGGEPFEDFVNTRVIAPLHLQNTRYGDRAGEALGYSWDGMAFQRETPSSPAYAFSAAAISSDVPDLLRFMRTVPAPYYGLMQNERFGADVWYASGNVNGYSAFGFLIPATGDEAVMLCNADKVDLAPLALDLVAALRPTAGSAIGPAENEDPRVTAAMRERARTLFAPKAVALLEFLRSERAAGATTVEYRVTLSDGTRLLLRAPVRADGSLGAVAVTPL